ncbi:Beta-secretase 2 [Phlyctochytrium bullatum]|nr:Beta-secretase 2 [Phlyctochytrium bullatum]
MSIPTLAIALTLLVLLPDPSTAIIHPIRRPAIPVEPFNAAAPVRSGELRNVASTEVTGERRVRMVPYIKGLPRRGGSGGSKTGRLGVKEEEGVQELTGGTLLTGCWNTELTADGQKFAVSIDSGSSDLVLPGPKLPNYATPTNPFPPRFETANKPQIARGTVRTLFADGSAWAGRMFRAAVEVAPGVAGEVPVAVAEQQTSSPPAITSRYCQGLLGLGFDSLSINPARPATLLTSLRATNALRRDRVALRGCPAAAANGTSFIDWGADDAALACSVAGGTGQPNATAVAWVAVTRRQHYTVQVSKVAIGEGAAPTKAWDGIGGMGFPESLVDSCTTVLMLPPEAFEGLVRAVNETRVFQDAGLGEEWVGQFLTNLVSIPSALSYNLTLLPPLRLFLGASSPPSPLDTPPRPLGFDNPSSTTTTAAGEVELILRGSDYVQSDGNGRTYFPVQPSDDGGVVLGSAVFDLFYVVLDREEGRVGFGGGCECEEKGASNIVYHPPEAEPTASLPLPSSLLQDAAAAAEALASSMPGGKFPPRAGSDRRR